MSVTLFVSTFEMTSTAAVSIGEACAGAGLRRTGAAQIIPRARVWVVDSATAPGDVGARVELLADVEALQISRHIVRNTDRLGEGVQLYRLF